MLERGLVGRWLVVLWMMFAMAAVSACGGDPTGNEANGAACKGVTCASGICRDGECVNKSTCKSAADCIENYECSADGQCTLDVCAALACERGLCSPERGQCINDGVCTTATEQTACLEGFFCYGNSCVSEAALCQELGCETGRGVCDPHARACINADNCQREDGQRDDSQCLTNYYCNDDNACELNLCMGPVGECARGVCEPETGTCVNREQCAASTDCLDNHHCLSGSCIEVELACSACTGNQECVYEAPSQSVHCEEKTAGCLDARDCLGDRVCVAGSCSAPSACVPDVYEPNDVPANAVDLNGHLALQKRALQATICGGDQDLYRYTTAGQGLTRGQLVVQVRYAREDVGTGQLALEVRDTRGDLVASGTTDSNGVVTLTTNVGAHQIGEYLITVRDAAADSEDPVSVGVQGVHYDVFADFRGADSSAACEAATELLPGTLVGNTRVRAQYGLGMGCTTDSQSASGNVYWFELARRSHVDLKLTPAAGTNGDFGLSIRQPCMSALGELACANDTAKGGGERIRMPLDAGRYFVVVQGNTAATGGEYKIDFKLGDVVCHPGEAVCSGADTSRVCRSDGTGFENIACEMGCESSRGLCTREPGDACYSAIDASAGYDGEIDWLFYQNDVDPGADSCLPNNDTSRATAGADVAYVVNLPAGHSVQARLRSPISYNSLYLVTDCGQAADSCLAGSNTQVMDGVDEYLDVLVYHNTSSQRQRVYVIADSGPSLITAQAKIDIRVGAPSCEPGSSVCGALGREVCGPAGIEFELTRPCPFGCDNADASCAPVENNTCKGAVDILAWGGTFTGMIDDYLDNYNPGFNGCTGRAAPGRDAVFVLDAREGDIITARVDAQFDASLWLTTNCSQAAATCIAGADRYDTDRSESLEFIAPYSGKFYLVVDGGVTTNRGQFTLTVDVATPSCSPGSVLGCADATTLSYCSDQGVPLEYRCASGCDQGRCSQPTGDACVDALPLTAGVSVSGNFRGTNTMNPGLGMVSTCNFGKTEGLGPETVYWIDLVAGQRLTVDVQSQASTTMVYLLKSCSTQQSCLSNTPEGKTHRLEYDAPVDETIYIVVDRTRPSSSPETYSLLASVQTRGCVAGSVQCFGTQNLGVCDGEFLEPYLCDGGCLDDQCVRPRGEICQDSIVLTSGASVTGSWMGTSALNPAEDPDNTCDFGAHKAVGNDTIYAVDLVPGDVLHATLSTTAASALMYLMGDCLQQDSCRAAAAAGAGVLHYVARGTERVYLVIDRMVAGDLSTSYKLDIEIEQANCVANSIECAADGKTLQICDAYGLKTDYTCTGTCSSGQCNNPSGAHCMEAKPLVSGDYVESFFDGTNTIAMDSGRHGACSFDAAPAGPDTIYSIELRAGQRLDAFLTSVTPNQTTPSTMLLYLMQDCSRPNSCLAKSSGGDRGRLDYLASEDTTVYLVVDRTEVLPVHEVYALEVLIQTPGCVPGAVTCLDDHELGVCDSSGDFLIPYTCKDGCNSGRCGTPRGEICEDAYWLTAGTFDSPAVVTGVLNGTNAVNPGSGLQAMCSFDSSGARGPDNIYAVELGAGEVLKVTLETADSSALLYILEDCAQPGESCLANAGGLSSQLYYEATSSQTVFIVVDRSYAYDSPHVYTLKVATETPSCVPGDTMCSDAQTLSWCNDYGLLSEHTCANGCANDACINGSGDTCLEAIEAGSGGTFTGDFTGTSSMNLGRGIAGDCDFGSNEMVGADTIYAMDLQAGDILRADLVSADYYSEIYIMSDCTVEQTCLGRQATTGKLTYRSPTAQRVYVVVDRRSNYSTTDTYTLKLAVQHGECASGHAQCAADATALEICDADGLYQRYQCDGGCANARCNTPRGDICQDAVVVSDGDFITSDWIGTNTLNPGTGTVGACQFGSNSSNGSEKIYAIDVQVGDILEATLDTTHTSALLYVLADCGNASSCLANNSEKIGSQTLRWQANTTGRVFIVVDARSNSYQNPPFTLGIRLRSQECLPGTTQCGADGVSLQVCDASGVFDSFPCKSTCTYNGCDEPSGDICQDAIYLYDGEEFSGNFGDFKNRYNPGATSCMFGKSTSSHDGRDAVFAIELVAGQLLEATLTTSAYNAGMYILESCDGTASSQCIYASPGSSSLKFYADKSQTYYLVVDALSEYSVDFDLRVDIHDYQVICQPGGVRCDQASGVLTLCNNDGTIIEEQATCAFGCGLLGCRGAEPANSTCNSAYLITASTQIADDLSRFTNDTVYSAASCVNSATPGKDAVYRVRLRANDVLVAKVQVESGLTSMTASIVKNCNAAEATCEAGTRVSTYGTNELTYRAQAAEDVFIILDAYNADARGQYVLSVDIFQAECSANAKQCNGNVLQTCDNYGRFNNTTCYYGCNQNACLTATNNTCEDALDATNGLRFTGNMADFTSEKSPSGGTCSIRMSTGPEALFYVDARPFDRLQIRQHSPGFDSVLWVTTDCETPQLACVDGVDKTATNGIESLDFIVPAAGRYFIMADSYGAYSSGEFTLEVDVIGAACNPQDVTCIDGQTLGVCKSDRSGYESYACDGGCSASACGAPRGDICQDAVDATGGGEYFGDFATLSNVSSPRFGGCTGFEAPGPEAFYAVNLLAGQTLKANLSGLTNSVDLSLYILSTCGQADSCLVGSDKYGAVSETAHYTATSNETVYVVADSYAPDAQGEYRLVIDIQ